MRPSVHAILIVSRYNQSLDEADDGYVFDMHGEEYMHIVN